MLMEVFIQANGKADAGMAKDSTNKKMGRCILEDSKMERDMGDTSYTNKTVNISPFTKMEFA